MKKPFTIAVEAPCSQSWEEMQPTPCGRFCSVCQKIVVDFTTFSDEDFIRHFQQQQTASCGKFTEQQLSKIIPPGPKHLTFWNVNKYVAASLFAALGLSFKTSAQRKDTAVTQGISDNKSDNIQSEKLIVVKGIVKDENEEGIPGASLIIKGTNGGTVCDIDGKFELELAPQDTDYTIVCKAYSFITQEITPFPKAEIYIIMEKDVEPKPVEIYGGIILKRAETSLWQRITRPLEKK